MPKYDDNKARHWRAKVVGLHKAPNRQTAWWRTQSMSNPSPRWNSLITGNLTGTFVEYGYCDDFDANSFM
jgi:hypothetical protein